MMTLLPFILICALINSSIELEISAPSFPDLMTYFHASEAAVGGILTYNFIGFCVASLVYGPLSDAYGRRRIMLVGNGLLTLGATGCVLASSLGQLWLARGLQGAGAATSAVVVSAIIADVYRPAQAARLYGLMNAVFTTLMALAPILGGILNQAMGWRGNYGVLALVCWLSWGLLYRYLPETHLRRSSLQLRHLQKDYQQLLRSGQFLSAAVAPSLLYAGYLAFVAVAPFLYRQAFGLSWLAYTLHQGAVVAAFALTSLGAGHLTSKGGLRPTLNIAVGLCWVGSGGMLMAETAPVLTVAMSLFSIGFALIYPPVFAYSLEIFPTLKGTASSLIMAMRYLLCAAMTGLATTLYAGEAWHLALIIGGGALLSGVLIQRVIKKPLLAPVQ